MTERTYVDGDCIVEHLGQIELKDGRIFKGVVVSFPKAPPALPISVVWDRIPVRMVLADATKKSI